MNHTFTHDMPSLTETAIVCAHVAAGALLGSVQLRTLRSSVNGFARGRDVMALVGPMLGRLALLAGVMGLAALEGATPLLALTFGLLSSRWLLIRRFSETAP